MMLLNNKIHKIKYVAIASKGLSPIAIQKNINKTDLKDFVLLTDLGSLPTPFDF